MTATTEPTEIRAGDTWKWRREDLSSYPASTYSLTYRFKNASGGFEIRANADGDLFAIDVSFSTTGTYASGEYAWQAIVEGATGRHTVDSGSLTVLPSLFTGTSTAALDTRSHAQKCLDAINAQLEGRATSDQQEYEIRVGDSLRRVLRATLKDLIEAKAYYEALVASEQAAEDVANGRPDRRRTYVRFRCGV